MIDFTEICYDPDIGQEFCINRTRGKAGPGGWIPGSVQKIPAFGVIAPASDKILQMIPEGDRLRGSIMVVTETKMYTTSKKDQLISDQVTWQGDEYSVFDLGPWLDFSFNVAILERMTGN